MQEGGAAIMTYHQLRALSCEGGVVASVLRSVPEPRVHLSRETGSEISRGVKRAPGADQQI